MKAYDCNVHIFFAISTHLSTPSSHNHFREMETSGVVNGLRCQVHQWIDAIFTVMFFLLFGYTEHWKRAG